MNLVFKCFVKRHLSGQPLSRNANLSFNQHRGRWTHE